MKPRLIVFERHHLGDAVMALPFLRSATKVFETTVFCHSRADRFFTEAVPEITVRSSDKWPFAHLPKLGDQDVAACVWPDPRAHLAMKRSGAGRRIGFRLSAHNFYGADRPWRKRRLLLGQLAEKLLGNSFLTTPLDRAPTGQTHDESWAQIAGALGLAPDYSFPWLPLPEAPPDFQAFVERSRTQGKKFLALHPGGRLPGKRWGIPRFQSLLGGRLASDKFAVAIIQPPGESCPQPQSDHQRIFEPRSVPELGALFEMSDAVLCNDSLASQLAAAVGVPVATIFGSGDPAWFSPFGNARFSISTDACPHRPCVDRCVMPSVICLEKLSLHLVEEKLSAILADPSEKIPE